MRSQDSRRSFSERAGEIKRRAQREDLRDLERRNNDTAIRQRGHALVVLADVQSQRANTTATSIPSNCAMMKAGAPDGAMPAKVSETDRAMVTAGLAKEVEDVNQ